MKLTLGWLFLFLGVYIPSFAAGPITHLWVAERFCEVYEITDPAVVQEVMIGAEFPDIRYMAHIPRHITHPNVASLKEVCESRTAFEAGMKLHVWLDVFREGRIAKEVYEEVALYSEGHSATLLKFIEEEILADLYDGRQWSSHFYQVLSEECAFIERDIVAKWHNMVQWTMELRPSWLLYAQSYRGPKIGLSMDQLYKWSYHLVDLSKRPLFLDHMHSLLASVLAELEECKSYELSFQRNKI